MIKLWDSLPEAVEVDGRLVFINTDFRFWLLFNELIKNEKTTLLELSFVLKNEVMTIEILNECLKFFQNENTTPKKTNSSNQKVMDFLEDGEFIYSAFRKNYNINLLKEQLHWHEFLALYRNLFNSYKEIISYRSYDGNEKDFLKLKNEWALPVKKDKKSKKVISILLHGGDFTKGGEE